VAVCRDLVENNPRQYRDICDFTALDAFSQVPGLAEADAHLLSDYLPKARLKLADGLSHAAGTQDSDVGRICRIRCERQRKDQGCDKRFVDHGLPQLSNWPSSR